MRGTLTDSESLRVPLTTLPPDVKGSLRESNSLKEPFTDRSPPTPPRSPNVALGASDAPNATLGASHAPNATLGRSPLPARRSAQRTDTRVAQKTAASAPKHRGHPDLPQPRYEASLRFGGACQGIFPALTSTPEPSAQSTFGVPHATQGTAMSPPRATSRNPTGRTQTTSPRRTR
ncbi:hypothetical protein CU254_05385 [Amycolatopsis sp. AA4]|nr:hypothetical protein CU254_05385 [Amycolatopsis sp. AA4]